MAGEGMETLVVQVITWNVATAVPDPDTSLVDLLATDTPDLVVLALQEVKSQPQNLLSDLLLAGEDPWTKGFRTAIAPRGYVKVCSRRLPLLLLFLQVRSIRLLGTALSLFILPQHISSLRGLETQYTRLGMGGYWGNKGTVSVRWASCY